MEKKIVRHLNFVYYGLFALAVVVVTLMLYLMRSKGVQFYDPQSALGRTIQYIVIFYVILSVPGGLYGFKLLCKRLSMMEDEVEKYAKYERYAIVRLLVIGFGMSLGMFAFYFLSGYQSMMWCAAISAVGLYFCKPLVGKMEKELTPEDPNVPKY